MSVGAVIVARNPEDIKLELPCPTVKVTGAMSLNEARNQGAKQLQTDLIAFVDADNRFDPKALDMMADAFKVKGVGAVSPVIFDREGGVWFAGGRFNRFGVATFDRTRPTAYRLTESFHDVFMVKREAFEKAGGFDSERFPFYLGEADLAERIKALGYHFLVDPDALVWHDIEPVKGLKSIARGAHIRNEQRAYLVGRNLLLFLKLHRPKRTFALHIAFVLPVRTVLHVAGMLADHKRNLVKPYLKGIWDGLK